MLKPNEPPRRKRAAARWIGALAGMGSLAVSTAAQAEYLNQWDVGTIIAQAAQEAAYEGHPATIAIVDRAGNVLAAYRMNGANSPFFNLPIRVVYVASNDRGPNGGLNGLPILDTGAAIAKAITGAYLSSAGNAFSTRTASQIVQDHFNPGTLNAPSGPLYGVQFSSLPCSDVMRRSALVDPSGLMLGPKRSPFGLSADPGGFPLYKNGQNVGGIGVISDSLYGDDENITNVDHSADEIIALAGTVGFDAPTAIRADHITAGGLTLRYSDATSSDFVSNPAKAVSSFGAFVVGSFVDVTGYYAASSGFGTGVQYGTPASGLAPDTTGAYGTPAPLVMVNADGTVRYPAHAGRVTNGLSQVEVQSILKEGYQLSLQMRAQIRQPLNSQVAVTVSVVDGNGEILGSVTNQDAPVFGIDVSVQKARSALLMTGPYIKPVLQNTTSLTKYLSQSQAYFGSNILNGGVAFSATAIGNLSRDTYPDGIDGTQNGPFGIPQANTTPFNDGLQLDIITPDLVTHAVYISQAGKTDVGPACTSGIVPSGQNSLSGQPILANGMQIFPGGFPIYRNGAMVGAVGVSGDGVNQDDMTAFLGLYRGALDTNSGLGEAPQSIRASNLVAHGASPLYVSCPTTPLLNSDSSNLCAGK
jgi:uncharacterized protein GlcG (DUF336 family)